MQELRRLRDLALRPEGVVLLCWCAPKACHGDVIASALAWLDGRIREETMSEFTSEVKTSQ